MNVLTISGLPVKAHKSLNQLINWWLQHAAQNGFKGSPSKRSIYDNLSGPGTHYYPEGIRDQNDNTLIVVFSKLENSEE